MLFPAPQRTMHSMQSPVVTDQDLFKAIIVGCGQVGPGVKPCTKIVQILFGLARTIFVENEEIPILDTLQALTDGSPPGIVTAITDGVSNAVTTSPQAITLQAAAASGAPFCDT
jgi:hypothetical protein